MVSRAGGGASARCGIGRAAIRRDRRGAGAIAAAQQGQTLNPAKLDNAIQRARRDGRIAPPIVVRRVRDGYLLLDGLYRLRAAQAIGMARIAAVVEG